MENIAGRIVSLRATRKRKVINYYGIDFDGITKDDPDYEVWVDEPDERTRKAAQDALVQIGEPAIRPLTEAIREYEWVHFTSPLSGIGKLAAEVLARIGPSAVPALCGLMNDQHAAVQERAAKSLIAIGPRAVPGLCDLLATGDWRSHRAAIEALGAIRDPGALTALREFLEQHHSTGERLMVGKALASIGEPGTLPLFCEVLKEGRHWEREEAISCLRGSDDQDVIEALRLALQDADKDVCTAAQRALASLGTPAVAALIKSVGEAEHPQVRSCAEYALSEIGSPAVAGLRAALNSTDENVSLGAADMLGRITKRSPAPELSGVVMALLNKAVDDVGSRVCSAAKCALVEIGSLAVPGLCAALGSRDEKIRLGAAAALGRVAETSPARELSQAVPLLRRLTRPWSSERKQAKQIYRSVRKSIDAALANSPKPASTMGR